MVKLKFLMLFSFLLVASIGRAAEKEDLDVFKNLIDETMAVQENIRRPKLLRAYEQLFPSTIDAAEMRNLDDSVLRRRFIAADLVSFYTNDRADELPRYFGELVRRGQAKDLDYVALFGAYVADRDFVAAQKVKSQAEALGVRFERLPVLEDSIEGHEGLPTMLSFKDGEDVLTRTPFDLDGFTGAVVVSHPLCHFSVNAMTAIAADPAVGAAMKNALWLTPQDRRLHIDVLQKWNKDHPEQQFHIAYREAEWKAIPAWATPHFYFFDRGRLVADVMGWPSDGNMDAVRAGLGKIGLLDAPMKYFGSE